VTQQRALDEFAEAGLGEKERAAVLSENAARVFGI
jgi:predicted TIM-barrel fold metal-dependent hydrolase